MATRGLLDRLVQPEAVNFALTNRIPRALATRVVARVSRSENPVVYRAAMGVWRLFAGDLALHEARKTRFRSVHDCFTRQLKDGARPVDPTPGILVSPCDGIVGACGAIEGTRVFQAKGRPYAVDDLLHDAALVERHRDGCYVTLRLTSSMYHRFHAPDDCDIDEVTHVAGDTWNVNPGALARVDRLFCQNERAVVPLRLTHSREAVTLVPVAAILVAGIRLHFLDTPLNLEYRGPRRLRCQATLRRGEEMGYFEHGSTIIVFGTRGLGLCASVRPGEVMRMGRPLLTYV